MPASIPSICNRALSRIGITAFIDDLEQDGQEAAVCNVLYAQTRDIVLESHPWRFATRRTEELAEPADHDRDGWEKVYSLPSDYVSMIQIGPATRVPTPTARNAYAIEQNNGATGRVLLTDDTTGTIAYISNEVEEDQYTALFADAVSWLLASELAPALGKAALADGMLKKYFIALSKAQAQDATEAYEPERESPLITGRS